MVQVELEALTECSLTVQPAANGYLLATLRGQKQQGKELATLPHLPMARDKYPL